MRDLNSNIKTEWRIILHEPLVDTEIARLKEVASMMGMVDPEYNQCTINVMTHLDRREFFKQAAVWMSYIGGEESIFCIQEIITYYTGMVQPEVKYLMRTKA